MYVSADAYHCPVTFKVFNENSNIVAIRSTGNVFSYEVCTIFPVDCTTCIVCNCRLSRDST